MCEPTLREVRVSRSRPPADEQEPFSRGAYWLLWRCCAGTYASSDHVATASDFRKLWPAVFGDQIGCGYGALTR
jgi:hypothetical protein